MRGFVSPANRLAKLLNTHRIPVELDAKKDVNRDKVEVFRVNVFGVVLKMSSTVYEN